MAVLSNVSIEGFWGSQKIEFAVFDDSTFLIGVNGSGKSTILNLVGAALTHDFDTLVEIPFTRLELTFRSQGSRAKPRVEVTKELHTSWDEIELEYAIRDLSTAKPDLYTVNLRSRSRRIASTNIEEPLEQRLAKLIRLTWITVHRSRPYPSPGRWDRSTGSLMDVKLAEVNDRLVRYFSLLAGRADAQNESFQREVFLSLIQSETQGELFRYLAREAKPLDSKLRGDVSKIFSEFTVPESKYGKSLKGMFKAYGSAAELIRNGDGLAVEGFAAILQMRRLERLVEEWNVVEAKKQEILEGREAFLRLLNSMMQRKKIRLTETNELEVTTNSGKVLSLADLSSGEKQLLIFLGEALLQDRKPWLYMADEPEISLHIEWQAQLVRGIRELNPNVQLLMATHSPDLIAADADKVIDIESFVG